jgi:hypothetical protein
LCHYIVEEILPEPMRPLPPADRLVVIRRNGLPPVGVALRSGLEMVRLGGGRGLNTLAALIGGGFSTQIPKLKE